MWMSGSRSLHMTLRLLGVPLGDSCLLTQADPTLCLYSAMLPLRWPSQTLLCSTPIEDPLGYQFLVPGGVEPPGEIGMVLPSSCRKVRKRTF